MPGSRVGFVGIWLLGSGGGVWAETDVAVCEGSPGIAVG
jgi:hypothetical protein